MNSSGYEWQIAWRYLRGARGARRNGFNGFISMVSITGIALGVAALVVSTAVINGFSDLILELWGPVAGAHARSAVGMAELPFAMPVEIEGEVLIAD